MLRHLLELRRRGIQSLLCFAVLFLLFFFLAEDLLQALLKPLLQVLPDQKGLIALHITSPVFIPLKLAANTALLATIPFIFFHLWRFISPGLYKKEQQLLHSACIFSLILFIAGVVFCFYLVLPYMLHFFVHMLPKEVRLMPDVAYVIDFIIHMLLLFGLSFQVPLICLILVRLKIIELVVLKKIRPYVIVSAFIIGMLLTPPDVFSQILLALPLCLLYELGIILALYLED